MSPSCQIVIKFIFFLLPIALFGFTDENPDVTLNDSSGTICLTSELRKLHDISLLPRYEKEAKSYQVSSYDTTGGNNDGFNGTYSFIRRNTDSTLVLFDSKGPGVIHRIWTPTPTDDTLDFYIDDPDRVSFSIRFSDLFSGKAFPFIDPICGNQIGGFFCYLPIPFQHSCKIVFRGRKIQFHQIQYKLFTDDTPVKSFSFDLNGDERTELQTVKNAWKVTGKTITNFYQTETVRNEHGSIELQPGQHKTIFDRQKPGRILGIELNPAAGFEGIEKLIDIKINWDNEPVPAVYMPVHDLFGYAFGQVSMQSLLLGTKADRNYCYFPMPFDNSAKIELIHRENSEMQKPLNLDYTIYYAEEARDPTAEGKFYARWNRDIDPAKGKPHYLLNRNGTGHYVGTILQAQGLKAGMTLFFEGDDSTRVDGELVMHGTGSEDYFNGGWYAFIDTWDTKMSLPIHGSLDYSLPMCRTGGYRLFLSDKIPFTESFLHTIEHGPVNNAFPVDYTSVALYYSDSPDLENRQEPDNGLTSIYIPDTLMIYPQLMSYDVWDNIHMESMWAYNTGGLSYVYTVSDGSKLRISLEGIPDDTYRLYFDLVEFEEGCEFSVWQRQTQLSPWIDTKNPQKNRSDNLYACLLETGDFKNTLTLRFRTDTEGKKLFLNRLILVKSDNNEME